MDFGTNLKMFREKAGLSQAELAKLVYVTPGFICMLEQGFRQPSLMLALALAKTLNTDVETLAGF